MKSKNENEGYLKGVAKKKTLNSSLPSCLILLIFYMAVDNQQFVFFSQN